MLARLKTWWSGAYRDVPAFTCIEEDGETHEFKPRPWRMFIAALGFRA